MSDGAPSLVSGDAPVGGRQTLSPLAIDRILAEFRLWLEAVAGLEGISAPPVANEEPGETVDLATLIGQFVALRHEVNLQTRASRGQMEQGAQALEQLSQSLAALECQQAQKEEKGAAEARQDEAIRPMLKSLVDAHDSLNLAQREVQRIKDHLQQLASRERQRPESAELSKPACEVLRACGVTAANPAKLEVAVPLWMRLLGLGGKIDRALNVLQSRWLDSQAVAIEKQRSAALEQERLQAKIDSLVERIGQGVQSILTGYGMSLQRLERMLEQQGLEPIAAVGEVFDPERMEALEVMVDPNRPSGEVVEEVRRGYLWHGKVFRFAQVKVSRG